MKVDLQAEDDPRVVRWGMRLAFLFTATLAVAPLVGCTDTSCGSYSFFGEPAGEQCGPMGSFGFVYIDENIAEFYLEPYRELGDTESPYYDSLPFWFLYVQADRLEPGAVLEGDDVVGLCSYFPLVGSGQGLLTYYAESASLRVLRTASRNPTGGLSWRVAWEIDCEIGPSSGIDVIELDLLSSGFEGLP
jgi:hypothetical protein